MSPERLLLPLLCAVSVFAGSIDKLEVDSFTSRRRVLRLASEGGTVLVETMGGIYRLVLEFGADLSGGLEGRVRPPRPGDAARLAARDPGAPLRSGECEYQPRGRGLGVGCPSGASVIRLGGFPATAVAEHGGRVFVGTYGGGLRSADSPSRPVAGIPAAVTSLVSAGGRLVCGTEEGLFVFDGTKVYALRPDGPADNNISRLERGGGALWAATFDRGLSRWMEGEWRNWTVRDGLPSDWIDDIEWDGNRLWGAGDRGVFWIEGNRVVVPRDERLRAKTSALCMDGDAVLMAQKRRVLRWEAGRVTARETPEAHPQDILADADGLWLAGLDGLRLLPRKGGAWRLFEALRGDLPGDWVTALAPGDGGLLVGTYDRGFAVLDPAKGGHRVLLPHAWVNPGAVDAHGMQVAVGGMEEGLHLFREGRWRRLTREQGLAGDDVTSVLFDAAFLWVGTRSGVSRVRL